MFLNSRSTVVRRWGSLAAAIAATAFVWLVVLPLVESAPEIADHIALQKELDIDPSAMFYSELEIISEIAHRAERLREDTPAAFWQASTAEPPREPLPH